MEEIVYDWNFNPLEVVYNEDVLTNVVNVVHWQYTGTYTSGSINLYDRYVGTVSLDTPTSASFIPFESLTKETVEGWVTAKLGEERIAGMNTNLSSSLNNQLFPVKGILSPPW